MVIYKTFKDLSFVPHPNGGGIAARLRFSNDYGISVIRTDYSYGGSEGKFEIAVLEYLNESETSFELCYSTPVTDDVVGHLTGSQVTKYMKLIQRLPKKQTKGIK